jgi:sugar-specific transcriptional regulator TrmB
MPNTLNHSKNQITQMCTNENIHTLTCLGLTISQAKVYLVLTQVDQAPIRTIAQSTKVARQDIYRIIFELQKRGFVEKIVFEPAMYKALPIEEGLSMLLQQKKEENAKLQKKTKALLGKFQENKVSTALESEEQWFIIISGKKLFLKRFEETIDAAQMSLDFIWIAELFKKNVLYNFQQLKSAMKRGVKIRIITENAENPKSILRNTENLKSNPSFQLKYVAAECMINMLICDNKKAAFQLSDEILPIMWSNNPAELKLVTSYFESLWNNA